MQWFIFKAAALAAVLQSTSAAPVNAGSDGLQVVETTTTADGQVIDWVIPDSQTAGGKIASPPAAPPSKRSFNANRPTIEAILGNDPAKTGPKGTVPVLRASGIAAPKKRLPSKSDDGATAKTDAAASNAGTHWYASSAQSITNRGGKGTFSLYKAFVQSNSDFSLLQTAVIRTNADHAGTGTVTQTVEAGWINYPNQVGAPHLFSYFTTDGYSSEGDNVGGWNRDHAGWVQTDSTIYPGISFSPQSIDGGAQYELAIGYTLTGGNWWLWCLDRYIGYYPATLFSQGVNAGNTLADHSDQINFYGEIYNSEDAVTTTDMGSGEFPGNGFGKSAYIHNIVYVDTNNNYEDYNGQSQLIVSDKSRYDIIPTWSSGTSWGSYFYLGGPGAGGQVNA